MRRPFDGSYPITQPYGLTPFWAENRASYPTPGHAGVDYGLPAGTQLLAPTPGQIRSGNQGPTGWGYWLEIGTPLERHILAHCQLGSLQVPNGSTVTAGQPIGKSGETGWAVGAHLHYEIRGLGPSVMHGALDAEAILPENVGRHAVLSYMNYAASAAAREGLDAEIFERQIDQESGWDRYAYSRAGAIGIAQIVPRWHPGVNAWEPYESLDYAARLMAGHLRTFGSMALALAAYNAGSSAVRRYGGVPPFAETQNYVRAILGGTMATEVPESQAIDRFLHLKAQGLAEQAIGIVNRAKAGVGPTDSEVQAVNEEYGDLLNNWPYLWQIEKKRRARYP